MPHAASLTQVPMLPPCPVHGHPGHPRRSLDALPPGRCSEEALHSVLATYRRQKQPLLNPEQSWRKEWPRTAEAIAQDEARNALIARAIWLSYCVDPLLSGQQAPEQLDVPDEATARQVTREGLRQLRAVLGPWSDTGQDLLGAGTRLAWAVYGCSSDVAQS